MGKREENRQRRHAEIVSIAEYLFSEKGYDETSMAEIAQRIGVSENTVFNFFPKKRDILHAIFQQIRGHEFERAREIAHNRRMRALNRAIKIAEILLNWAEHYPRLLRRIDIGLTLQTEDEKFRTFKLIHDAMQELTTCLENEGKIQHKSDILSRALANIAFSEYLMHLVDSESTATRTLERVGNQYRLLFESTG